MEEHVIKLMAQVSVIGVLIYVVASAMGKGNQMKLHPHKSEQKTSPESNGWQHSGVRGPMATTLRAAAIAH